MVAADFIIFPIDVNDNRRLVSVDDNERADGRVVSLVGPLVISRVDIVSDLDPKVTLAKVGIKVELETSLPLAQGFHDSWDLYPEPGHKLTFASQG